MKLRKIIGLVTATAMAASIFTGCGSNNTATQTLSQEESTAEKTTAESKAPETAEKSAESGGFTDTNKDGKITIGFALKTVSDERWSKEAELIQKYADEMGAELLLQVANNDGALQVSQIENLLTQDIDVLMFNPIDESVLGSVLDEAHAAGIPILCYDYTIENLYVDAYIGPYDIEVGKQITKALADLNITGNVAFIAGDIREGVGARNFGIGMKETLESCDITYVTEQHCDNWDASIAQGYAENVLSQYGEDITAFAVMNDGMAAGVISALESAGLAGKVYVTGMDGELTAFQRIAKGTQLSTVLKPSDTLAKAAVELAYKMANGEELPEAPMTWDCGKTVCPFYKQDVVLVTADNLDEVVIDGGLYTHEEVYGK